MPWPHTQKKNQWEVREKSMDIDIFKYSRLFQWASKARNYWSQLHHADNDIVGSHSLLYPPAPLLAFLPIEKQFLLQCGPGKKQKRCLREERKRREGNQETIFDK